MVACLLMLRLSRSVNSLAGLFNETLAAWNQVDLHIVVLPSGTKKDVIFKNEPEKLLKTGSCGKNEPKTNRKTNRTMLLKIQEGGRRAGDCCAGFQSKNLR